MAKKVLLIGQGLFRDGLTHLLQEAAHLQIVGAADSWTNARELMETHRPDIVIVDHSSNRLNEADLAPMLQNDLPNLKVIYLTLADNHMIVHDQHQVSNVNVVDLLNALQPSQAGQE